MARQKSAESELQDMTECSICTEVFTDPRVLPCIHSFCLKCLLNYGKDRQPGDTMPCPLCRKEFTIPDDGLAGIQKNFFMEKLLRVRMLSEGKEAKHIPCDACSTDEASASETNKPAIMLCVQCQENYCDHCSRSHARMKATSDHVQVEIGKPLERETIVMKLGRATCEVHKGEDVKIFCLECELAICVMCFIKSHKNHDCSDIEEVAEAFRKQVTSDKDKVTEDSKKTEELLAGFEGKNNDLIRHFADVESEINKTADKLIDAIQHDRKKLLSEVESIRQKRVKQLETVKQEVEQHMAALESFKRYSETLLSSGTACDLARSAKSLHDRADELAEFDVIGHVERSLPWVTVKFTLSTAVNPAAINLIGDVSGVDKSNAPTVTHVIPKKGKDVGAVTSHGDYVFVARINSKRIELYDAVNFTVRGCFEVPDLGSLPLGLTVCANEDYGESLYVFDYYKLGKTFYVSDFNNHRVRGGELCSWSCENDVENWDYYGGFTYDTSSPVGVSVSSAENLLVVSIGDHKLQEFTADGIMVREIQLQAEIEYPRHVVHLSDDEFLVSHGGSLHRVCLVDDKGAVVRSFGGPPGSDLTKLNEPGSLAVDRHGNVLVADRENNRLLVLDPSLNSAHEMSVTVAGGLKQPRSLHYDKSRHRLYVAEWKGRIIFIDNVDDFNTSPM